MNITLLRHGKTNRPGLYVGRLDLPVSEAGLDAMRRATEGLVVQRVISSPLSRCRRFAEEFARRQALPLTVEPHWQEMDFGDWEGRTAAEILTTDRPALEAFWEDPTHHAPPGGESLDALRQRLLTAWEKRPQEGDLLIVTHGGPMRLLFQQLLGLPTEALWRLELNPAARLDFVIDENGARLRHYHCGEAH